jgi:hypothetical protein
VILSLYKKNLMFPIEINMHTVPVCTFCYEQEGARLSWEPTGSTAFSAIHYMNSPSGIPNNSCSILLQFECLIRKKKCNLSFTGRVTGTVPGTGIIPVPVLVIHSIPVPESGTG